MQLRTPSEVSQCSTRALGHALYPLGPTGGGLKALPGDGFVQQHIAPRQLHYQVIRGSRQLLCANTQVYSVYRAGNGFMVRIPAYVLRFFSPKQQLMLHMTESTSSFLANSLLAVLSDKRS